MEPPRLRISDTRAHTLRSSALTEDLSFLLARANALSIAAGNAALAEHSLRGRSYSVLALAAGDIRPSQRELAEFLRLDPSQIVSLIDDLERRGLVRRESDPADRRANVVVATDAGQKLFIAAERATREAEQRLHVRMPPGERKRLRELLKLLAFPE